MPWGEIIAHPQGTDQVCRARTRCKGDPWWLNMLSARPWAPLTVV